MNETIKTQLLHRTIREFKPTPIPEEIINILSTVAIQTPTSTGTQTASVIRITDKELKKAIADICKQEYVARLPEFWIFLVDTYRNSNIAKEMNCIETGSQSMTLFFQAYIDAALMAQNVQNSAESLGLGAAFFGSIYNNTELLIPLLKLPKLTFPVIGLGFGYPNQTPQQKPRLKKELRIFENNYISSNSYLDDIKEYDMEMTTYYDLRSANKRSETFRNIVVNRLSNSSATDGAHIIKSIKQQGFAIE